MNSERVKAGGAPAADAQWQKTTLTFGRGKDVDVLIVPDATRAGVHYALLERPAVERTPGGSPKLSISFALRRQPDVGQPDISGLVERAVVGIDLGFLPPLDLLSEASSGAEAFRPLFGREASFYVVDLEAGRSLGEVTVHNGQGSAALSLTLEREGALRFIEALNGRRTSIRVGTWVTYRAWGASGAVYPGVEIHAPLEDVLSEALGGMRPEDAIHLIAPEKGQRGFSEVPWRTQGVRARPAHPGKIVAMASLGGTVTALSQAVKPSAAIAAPAHTVLAAQGLQGRLSALALHDLQIVLGPERRRHLPVIGESAADGPWPDRIDWDRRRWYAPEFVAVVPKPTASPEDSPFLFSYRTMGHDPSGRPSLEATICLRLRRTIPEAVNLRMEEFGDAQLNPVVVKNLSCLLEIPFRDEGGDLRRETVRATEVIDAGEEVDVTFRLVNDWVRLAYGSLAYADFQPGEPLGLSVAYTFEAYTEIKERRFEFVAGGKSARLPLVDDRRARASSEDRDHLGLGEGTVRVGGSELKLASPKAVRAPPKPAPLFSVSRPSDALHMAALPVVRPDVQLAPSLFDRIKRKKYALLTRAHRDTGDLLMPCSDFGTLYVQERDTGSQRVGCNDAFTLGRTEYRLYEQLPLSQRNFKVMRSLQTPGRFLVVPQEYAITRFAATEGEKAFRPSILLYSTIDIDELSKSRCVIMASLQPQVSSFERQHLLDELRRDYHPEPMVEYLTEIEGEFSFEWALPSTGPSGLLRLETEATRLWDSFQVSLVTDAIGVPQLQEILSGSGIHGSATLRLGDGSTLRSSLRMDLARITGPWDTGPVEVDAPVGGGAVLRNRIEATVNVSDLMIVKGGRTVETLSVEARLGQGNEASVEVDQPFDALLPVYTVEPSAASLTEVRTFIEDIEINLALVNQVDLEALGLKKIEVTGRVQGGAEERAVEFSAGSPLAASLDFLLPLTVYLTSPIVELRATVTEANNQQRQLPWVPRPLSQGVIVEITPEFIGI